MASVSWGAESVEQNGPSHCWVDSFLLPWSHCIGTMNVAAPERWVVSSSWSIADAPFLIIEFFGSMCQDSPKNGSHLSGQIKSKLHGQAFSQLGEGKIAILWGLSVLHGPPSNTQSRLGQGDQHIFARKRIASAGAIAQE